MAKFSGKIGFGEIQDVGGSVHKDVIVAEKHYKGDVLKNTRHTQSDNNQVNDNIVMNDRISIVADPYINSNFLSIRYVIYMGVKWKVTNIDSQSPRLILTLGGVYNG